VGHGGMPFRAGQFVWLTIGGSPFSVDQHPFSVSSAEAPGGRMELTVKELGDYTDRIGEVEPGSAAYLDGPYGSFVLDDDADGAVFVAGGIGITPVMSILRTLRGSAVGVPSVLLYGMGAPDTATFMDELREMDAAEWLRFVPVAERAPPEWEGARGRITPALLERHLPPDRPGLRYLICGPDPMMDAVESFLSGRGVPFGRVHSERFNIA
jgi:predicted ferric reductase